MKFQRNTVILATTALFLGGLVYLLEVRPTAQQEEAKTQQQQIFSFKEQQVRSFQITTQDQTLKFVKKSDPPASPKPNSQPASSWTMEQPKSGAANDATIAYLLSLLASGQATSQVSVPTNRLDEFGLVKPTATITVTLDNQQTHRLVLGKANFNRSALYAQADPKEGAGEQNILSVSTAFEDAINRPVAEWQKGQEANSTP
ncbi:MAG: DUF4340 domain-containing protein [Leptolyngbyaceae cyanobacterium bins.59]|nr:DUF4340 domain-containing protein [Leptolyngbyaceae cyanobacterium bins.59]